MANSFWNHVIQISSRQMYFQDIYSNLWKVKVFIGNIYSLKSNTYLCGTVMFVQDGFLYLIVAKHKLTVQCRSTQSEVWREWEGLCNRDHRMIEYVYLRNKILNFLRLICYHVKDCMCVYKLWAYEVTSYTAKTKCRKFETNIPRKGISGPQSLFPHSCVCERIIYSHDGSACSAGGNM